MRKSGFLIAANVRCDTESNVQVVHRGMRTTRLRVIAFDIDAVLELETAKKFQAEFDTAHIVLRDSAFFPAIFQIIDSGAKPGIKSGGSASLHAESCGFGLASQKISSLGNKPYVAQVDTDAILRVRFGNILNSSGGNERGILFRCALGNVIPCAETQHRGSQNVFRVAIRRLSKNYFYPPASVAGVIGLGLRLRCLNHTEKYTCHKNCRHQYLLLQSDIPPEEALAAFGFSALPSR